jgi:hypothetical protein
LARVVAGIASGGAFGRLQIGNARPQAVRVVIAHSQHGVAFGAKQTAHPSGQMTMIDLQPTFGPGFLFASRTAAALSRQHGRIVGRGESVATL